MDEMIAGVYDLSKLFDVVEKRELKGWWYM